MMHGIAKGGATSALVMVAMGLLIASGVATAGEIPGKVTGGGSITPGAQCDGSLISWSASTA